MFEASKAMKRRMKSKVYQKYFVGDGIDIGCGDDNIIKFKGNFPINSCRGYDKKDGDAQTCLNILDESYNFLHSSHCLEHMNDPVKAMLNWIRIVKTGGYLVVVVPDEDMYEKGKWPSVYNNQHKWSFRLDKDNDRPTSVNVRDFFDQFNDVNVVSISRITDGYYDSDEDLTRRTDVDIECSIEIVLQKKSHTYRPVQDRVMNGFAFMLNSLAMGDVIAAAPVIKYMIDRYYQYEPRMYKVVAKKMFRDLFHFVPDSNFHEFEDSYNDWDIPSNWAVGALNQKNKGTNIIRLIPKAMHLGQYAATKLVGMNLTRDKLQYVPLLETDISKFDHDFSKSVIMVSTYRDETRMWRADYMIELAAWIKTKGYTPVFVGKTDMNLDTRLIPKTSLPQNIEGLGLDLRNKTTIRELATIMSRSAAVVGLDSGPIHLAGTTNVPIVCGYTTVDAVHRVPIRSKGVTHVVSPDIQCKYCESNWASHFWNYEKCYFGHSKCCDDMTPQKFIQKLKMVL